ncbi:CP4B1 protein, partial [Leiothrix lutea]|nr:CP4B1 protein [Leiothrix lutea]
VSRVLHLAAVFCLTCVLLKAIQLFHRRRELLRALADFPGYPTHWLFGHVHEFLKEEEVLDKAEIWAQKYPHAHPMWFGSFSAVLVITDPDYAKVLLSRGDPKDNISYKHLVPWIGKGLLILHGPKWHQHRKLLTPGFHYDVLKAYVGLMAESTNVMLVGLRMLLSLPCFLFPILSEGTEDSVIIRGFIITSCLLGNRGRIYVFSGDPLCEELRKGSCLHSKEGQFCSLASPDPAEPLTLSPPDKVIHERKESLKDEREFEKIQKKRHLDFLDILLCAKVSGKEGICSDRGWMAVGGGTWQHRQWGECGAQPACANREDLGKMTYSTMCIKESLRLYPPVPGVSRQLSKPITFPDGRTLPEGSITAISIYLIHRNPEVWKDPLVFDPLRFSPENVSGRHSHAFLPFSAGTRNCIGQQFAMNEMKVALALTLLRFELLPDPDTPPLKITRIILRSKNGIPLYLKKI